MSKSLGYDMHRVSIFNEQNELRNSKQTTAIFVTSWLFQRVNFI